MPSSSQLQELLDSAVQRGVFPSAQAVVLHQGARVFEGAAGDAQSATMFDLASLTKVMCTTAAFMALWADDKVTLETDLATFFPRTAAARAQISLADLLYHRSGLPAFVPFFAPLMEAFPALFSPACPPVIRAHVRNQIVEAAKSTHASSKRTAVYSDVGFILLGEALAKISGLPLDELYKEKVADKLELGSHFRRISDAKPIAEPIAPTGTTRPREPAPGQEGLWKIEPHPTVPGEVDDDNAWAMDGIAGHAGLFGTAADVAKFGQAILDELGGAGKLAPQARWQLALAPDSSTAGSTRALGFDTPLPPDAPGQSSAGRHVGRIPPGAVGHLGFTGVSLWIDLARGLVVALCTNRTLLGRNALGIHQFRPQFHDAVVESLGLAT
jgi:CubicO group peptidase (beta-lactamase class C family)